MGAKLEIIINPPALPVRIAKLKTVCNDESFQVIFCRLIKMKADLSKKLFFFFNVDASKLKVLISFGYPLQSLFFLLTGLIFVFWPGLHHG